MVVFLININMFQVIFVALLLVNVLYGQEEIKEECRQKYNLDSEFLVQLEKKTELPEDNKDFNDYSACVLKKRHILGEHGEINWESLIKDAVATAEKNLGIIPGLDVSLIKPAVEEALKTCKSKLVPGASPGQTVVRVRNCYASQGNDIYKKIGLSV